ncbi:MAG: HprK-related kinase A [Rhodoferax sp.]|nr:HprK-related kinase A [Rhodoferax sp.]
MTLSQIDEKDIAAQLSRGELLLNVSPFVARIKSDVLSLARDIAMMYGQFGVADNDSFADFHIEVTLDGGLRRWIKPVARFAFDGKRSFLPLPAGQAFPMMEWGLNWCVAAHAHQYLVVHAAVIEKSGKAVMFPAPPGSGKSTLCAGLVHRGWRLLSDELALCDMDSGLVFGMARPINLKNRSIDVIRKFAPDAILTAPVPDTAKGTVALVRPPSNSVLRAGEPVRPNWIVLPKFSSGAAASLERATKADTFMLVAEQSFNYDIHGVQGFKAVTQLITHSDCYQFTYSDLNDAVRVFDELLDDASA